MDDTTCDTMHLWDDADLWIEGRSPVGLNFARVEYCTRCGILRLQPREVPRLHRDGTPNGTRTSFDPWEGRA